MEDQQQRYERARARVQAIKGFYIHASVFVVVNLGLFIINALTSGLSEGIWWFYWPLIGWGIGLGAHALGVFGFGGGGPFGQEWEERKTKEIRMIDLFRYVEHDFAVPAATDAIDVTNQSDFQTALGDAAEGGQEAEGQG